MESETYGLEVRYFRYQYSDMISHDNSIFQSHFFDVFNINVSMQGLGAIMVEIVM